MTMLGFQLIMGLTAGLLFVILALVGAEIMPSSRLGQIGTDLMKAFRSALPRRGLGRSPPESKDFSDAACQARLLRIRRLAVDPDAGGRSENNLFSSENSIDRLDCAFERFERAEISIAQFRSLAEDELREATDRKVHLSTGFDGRDDGAKSEAVQEIEDLIAQLEWCVRWSQATEHEEKQPRAA